MSPVCHEEDGMGRKLRLPVLVSVAQPPSYCLLIRQLWRPRERQRGQNVWDSSLWSRNTLVRAFRSARMLVLHTHTHRLFFFHSVDYLFHPSMSAQSLPWQESYLQAGITVRTEWCTVILSSVIQIALHHQVALGHNHSKWPIFSKSNDKAVCI